MPRPKITDEFSDGHYGYGYLTRPDVVDALLAQHNEHATALDTIEVSGGGTGNHLFNVLDYGADPTGDADCTSSIKAAIAAASAEAESTGRRAVVFFPGGVYKVTNRVDTVHIPLSNVHSLDFAGAPEGLRSTILLTGDSESGNWHMFGIDTGSYDLGFRNLVFNVEDITNPDPIEQSHHFQVGTECHDLRWDDCEFNGGVGDCLRLLGEFGERVYDIRISRCRFLEFSRAGVSFQRWVQGVTISDCYFRGGDDQQIDFEPTGTTLLAASGSDATTIISPNSVTFNFTELGLKPGDHVYNGVEQKMCKVVSVDSAAQITTTAGCTDWTGDTFRFPLHEGGHIIVNNRLDGSGNNASGILLSMDESFQTKVIGNIIGGTVFAVRMDSCAIIGNHFEWRNTVVNTAPINVIMESRNCLISGNTIVARSTENTDITRAISVAAQNGNRPANIIISNNNIYCDTDTTAIYLADVESAHVTGNTIRLNTPGVTDTSVGIFVGAVGFDVGHVSVVGNHISAEQGAFLYGIDFAASGSDITSCLAGDNVVSGCGTEIVWLESGGGVFANPPVLMGGLHEAGSVTPPSSLPWVVIGGIGGPAPTTGSKKPGIFWGSGSPESVLAAGIGSIALRYDGGTSTAMYVKESGTSTTGWVAK